MFIISFIKKLFSKQTIIIVLDEKQYKIIGKNF